MSENTDPVDYAAEQAEALNEEAVQAARSKVPDPRFPGPEFCPECDEPIPEKRRKMGYKVCVDCAE